VGVEIICPIYNGKDYIEQLNQTLRNQKNIEIDKISYILTESSDESEEILKKIGATYTLKIEKQ
jgi:rhamnosyltransferase